MTSDQILQIANNPSVCLDIFNSSAFLRKIAQDYGSEVLRNELGKNTFNDTSGIHGVVDEDTLSRLFDMVAAQWKTMGENKPHWSVLSSDEWLPEKLTPEKLEEFYASGKGEVDLLDCVLNQANVHLPSSATCMELGCGVGRATQHLARRFAEVAAVDISPGNLEICRVRMAEQGLSNVTSTLLVRPEAISELARCDVFFSRIVLQHNPPPIQLDLLDRISKSLNPGGILFFQVITGGTNYSYNAVSHLANWQNQRFEMHALPIPMITKTLSKNGYRLAHTIRDLAGGYGVDSFTLLAVPV